MSWAWFGVSLGNQFTWHCESQSEGQGWKVMVRRDGERQREAFEWGLNVSAVSLVGTVLILWQSLPPQPTSDWEVNPVKNVWIMRTVLKGRFALLGIFNHSISKNHFLPVPSVRQLKCLRLSPPNSTPQPWSGSDPGWVRTFFEIGTTLQFLVTFSLGGLVSQRYLMSPKKLPAPSTPLLGTWMGWTTELRF